MSAPPRYLSSLHVEYPDNDSVKDVVLHAQGQGGEISPERHILLQWVNGWSESSMITQVVRLTGQAGSYNYFAPVVKIREPNTNIDNQVIPVGTFTRAQRDQILYLASQVNFLKTSVVNNCRVWLRELLQAMFFSSKYPFISFEAALM